MPCYSFSHLIYSLVNPFYWVLNFELLNFSFWVFISVPISTELFFLKFHFYILNCFPYFIQLFVFCSLNYAIYSYPFWFPEHIYKCYFKSLCFVCHLSCFSQGTLLRKYSFLEVIYHLGYWCLCFVMRPRHLDLGDWWCVLYGHLPHHCWVSIYISVDCYSDLSGFGPIESFLGPPSIDVQ